MKPSLKFELAIEMVKQADMSNTGSQMAGFLPVVGPAIYGATRSEKHPVRDALALAAGSAAGGYGGAFAGAHLPLLVEKLIARGGSGLSLQAFLALTGAGVLGGGLSGSAAGSGLTEKFLLREKAPHWRQALGL